MSENGMAEAEEINAETTENKEAKETAVETSENNEAKVITAETPETTENKESEETVAETTETQETAAAAESISYHAVEKEGSVTAIWEMQGRKHLRTIDPRSNEGKQILALFETAA